MVRVRKPLGRKKAPKCPAVEIHDSAEDREIIEALNRSWLAMGMEEAELLSEADQEMKKLKVKK
jgi:hypothetical protein